MKERRYPEPCMKNIDKIICNVKTDEETAYTMILLTATLMDLCPGDPKVAEIILDDCMGRRVICKDG